MALVYVVDDDQGTRETFEYALRLAGYSARTAETGERGLEMVTRQQPDVLIVDFKLGDMTGLEMIRELRSQALMSMAPLADAVARHPWIESAIGPAIQSRQSARGAVRVT